MSDIFDRLFNRKPKSASYAKDRLQTVLMHDRASLTPAQMTRIKEDLVDTVSRYVDIETNSVKIKMSGEGRKQRLIADIPLRSTRRNRNN